MCPIMTLDRNYLGYVRRRRYEASEYWLLKKHISNIHSSLDLNLFGVNCILWDLHNEISIMAYHKLVDAVGQRIEFHKLRASFLRRLLLIILTV